MAVSRLFWPQELLDQWIVEEKISIEGEELTIQKEQRTYRVTQAVQFVKDVGDGADNHKLLGRVKELKILQNMGAEHYMDSVIIEDSAYEVVPGFIGELHSMESEKPDHPTDAASASGGDGDGEPDDRDLLAKFLIENL
jgi:hypothetical protein